MKKASEGSSFQEPLLIIGAGGHAVSMLTLLSRCVGFKPMGLIDSFQQIGKVIHGLQILGSEAELPKLSEKHSVKHFLVAIGDNFQRHATAKRLQQRLPDAVLPTLVDPSAVVAADAQLAPGVVVMAQAHVGAGCVLAEGSLLNTQASLDHDSSLDPFASLAPGVTTGGRVRIGTGTFIGLGANLIHGVQVGSHTVVGAGSLVLSDLPDGVLAFGTPARVVRSRHPHEPYF